MAGIKHAFVSEVEDGADATLVRPSNWNAAHAGLKIARKTSDETVNNSETLQDDDDLVIAVGANDVWAIQLMLFHISTSTTPDIDIAFTVPSGGAIKGMILYLPTAVGSSANLTAEFLVPVYTSETASLLFLTYIGGGTAGNVQLQWAQHTATVEDTKMLADSFLLAHQLV